MRTSVREVLVESVATDGAQVSLAALQDNRLMILQEGETIGIYERSDAGLGAALHRFLQLCGDRRANRGGLPSIPSWHPYAG